MKRLQANPTSRAARGGGGTADPFAEELTDVGPGSTVAGIDEQQLAVLRQVGDHWGRVLGPRPAWLHTLPIDPGLHQFPRSLEAGGGARFAAVDFVETADSRES